MTLTVLVLTLSAGGIAASSMLVARAGESPWAQLRAFTFCSNAVVALACALTAAGRPAVGLSLAAFLMIATTCVVYYTVLHRWFIPMTLPWWMVGLVQHLLVPVAYSGWFISHGSASLTCADVAVAVLIPNLWLGWTLARAAAGEDVGYPFLRVATIGWRRALSAVAVLEAANIAAGWAITLLR